MRHRTLCFGGRHEASHRIQRQRQVAHRRVLGFQRKRIVLPELGYSNGWCDHATFRVAGIGYSTDFRALVMEPAYDEGRNR